MTRAASLPSPFDSAPFSTRAALEAGIGRERLRRRDLATPFQGVRMHRDAADSSLTALCAAYASRLPPGGAFSHTTAAQLHGLPVPSRLIDNGLLHAATLPPHRSIRARRIHGHKLDLEPTDVVLVSGLPVTSPARTWIDLAPLCSIEDLVVIGDFILWWRAPLADRRQLARAVYRGFGFRGITRSRAALPQLSDRSDSPPESRIRYRFHAAGLPTATPNLPLFDARGKLLAMPDLTFVEYREIYDYEGDHHRTDREQWEKDLDRVPRLEAAGWHTTRGSRRDLSNTPDLIRRVRRLLRAKGWTR